MDYDMFFGSSMGVGASTSNIINWQNPDSDFGLRNFPINYSSSYPNNYPHNYQASFNGSPTFNPVKTHHTQNTVLPLTAHNTSSYAAPAMTPYPFFGLGLGLGYGLGGFRLGGIGLPFLPFAGGVGSDIGNSGQGLGIGIDSHIGDISIGNYTPNL